MSCVENSCVGGKCSRGSHILCNCEKELRLPSYSLPFVLSQRSRSTDVTFADLEVASESWRRNEEVKAKKKEREDGYKLLEQMDNAEAAANMEAFLNSDDNEAVDSGCGWDDDDDDYELEIDDDIHKSTLNMCDLPLTALMAMKYNYSNRGTAAVINGFLVDLKIVSSVEEAAKLIDHKKIYR